MKIYLEARSADENAGLLQTEITEGILDEDGNPLDPQTAMAEMLAAQLSRDSLRPIINSKVQPTEVKYYKHICYHDSVPSRSCELIEIDPETMEDIKDT